MSADYSLEHHSVHLNGIKQHYVKAGSGPAVMLLHGWPQIWYEWRHVIKLLMGQIHSYRSRSARFRLLVQATFRI
jgi:pimeloyl-ACP methyl ester carboxylesterase